MTTDMIAGHYFGQLAILVGYPQTDTQLSQQLDRAQFVSTVTGQLLFGGRAFAEIVGQSRKTHPGIGTQPGRLLKDHQKVTPGVDFRMPAGRLRYAEQTIDFRKNHAECLAIAQRLEKCFRVAGRQCLERFLPDTFRHQRVDLACACHLRHQFDGLWRDTELQMPETGGKAGRAQNPHRIFDESVGHVTQQPCLDVGGTVVRIDQSALLIFGNRVDGEVTPREILFECDIGSGIYIEALVTATGFALGAGQRIFFAGFGVQENRKIGADLAKPIVQHVLRRCTDDNPVSVAGRFTQQTITNSTTDAIDFHRDILATAVGRQRVILPSMRFFVLVICLLLVLPMAGCARTGYYLQSVRGQMDLLSRRVDIEELLEDPATAKGLRARLITLSEIREFASAELGLPDNRSYRSYADVGRPYVVWNVFAAPEFSVNPQTWCFLFVGCISYRGYFSEERAQEFAAGLAAGGTDVYVGGIAAYSTLGRFNDPVLNTMLGGDDVYLAGLIFHELSHQQLYIKDATAFNEGFATLVEEEGVRRWLASRDDEQSWAKWRRRADRREQFNEIVALARERLAELYASEMDTVQMRAKKKTIIEQLRADHQRLRKVWGGYSGYEAWFQGPLNNAQLGSVATYRMLVPAFRALLIESDQDLSVFYQRAREIGELPAAERERSLAELAGSQPDSF